MVKDGTQTEPDTALMRSTNPIPSVLYILSAVSTQFFLVILGPFFIQESPSLQAQLDLASGFEWWTIHAQMGNLLLRGCEIMSLLSVSPGSAQKMSPQSMPTHSSPLGATGVTHA